MSDVFAAHDVRNATAVDRDDTRESATRPTAASALRETNEDSLRYPSIVNGSMAAYGFDDLWNVGFRVGAFPRLAWRPLQRGEEFIGGGGDREPCAEPVYWGRFWTPEGLPWMIEVRHHGPRFHTSLYILKRQVWGERSLQSLVDSLGGGGWALDSMEPDISAGPVFVVMRRDDNNNEFEVSRHASQEVADAEVSIWSRGGHKQDYWVDIRR